MVRYKSRYILCEIIHSAKRESKSFEWRDIYEAVKRSLKELHGDYAIGACRNLPSLTVIYLSEETNIVMIRAKRSMHKYVQSALVFVKKIGQHEAFLRTLHLGGSIRSCNKFLIQHHKSQLPLLLQECTTEDERKQVQEAIVKSCKSWRSKLSVMNNREKRKETKT